MFKKAAEIMRETGFDFLFSGEVVGQCPMSQTKPSLRYVEKNSAMTVTSSAAQCESCRKPRWKNGLVHRRMLHIAGRTETPYTVAEDFGLTEYPAPAGGCR